MAISTLQLNEQQKAAVHYTEGPLLVVAGAGSGKTRVIIEKIVYLVLKRGLPSARIAAITFTNKAAREMKERLGKRLGREKAAEITVSTFHSLGWKILRAHHERSRERATTHLDKLREMFSCVLLAVALGFSQGSGADVPPWQTGEVEHLLAYLQYSDCQMIRNGKVYDSKDGVKHVRRKYDYFRNKISSTEEFIDYAATKSLRSGQSYQVLCPGFEPVPSADWLREELKIYRSRAEAH